MALPAVLPPTRERVSMPGVALCRVTAYMAQLEPCSPARKSCPSAAAAELQFPKELIPVAGGGGAKGISPRRRKGREGSAVIGRKSRRRGAESRSKEEPPKPRAVPPKAGRDQEAGEDG